MPALCGHRQRHWGSGGLYRMSCTMKPNLFPKTTTHSRWVAKSELYSLSPARSPGLRAGRSEALQQPLLVFQVLAHFLAHVEDGAVSTVEDGGQGLFLGL